MATTYLSPGTLFMINGIIEGLVGILAIFNPKIIPNKKGKLHKDGEIFAGFFGPLLFAMSYISILMIKVNDTEIGKLYFAFGWVLYHCGAAYNCFKVMIGGKKALIGGLIFHTFMLASFLMYLKANNFEPMTLLPF